MQNWIASIIEAESPIHAAKEYIQNDSEGKYAEYREVVVSWGSLGRKRQTFMISQLMGGSTISVSASCNPTIVCEHTENSSGTGPETSPSSDQLRRWQKWISPGLFVVCAYAMTGAITGGCGLPSAFDRFNSAFLPSISLLVFSLLIASSICLYLRNLWGQRLFLVIAPWLPVALAIVFKRALWPQDIPYTVVLMPLYPILMLFLSRGTIIAALTHNDYDHNYRDTKCGNEAVKALPVSWLGRGGIWSVICLVILILMVVVMHAQKPARSNADGLLGHIQNISNLGAWVDAMVLCYILMIQYALGVCMVSIPTKIASKPSSQAQMPPADIQDK